MIINVRPHIKPPVRLLEDTSFYSNEIAIWFGNLYNKARSLRQKARILGSLLYYGGTMDLIIRSCGYYDVFEETVGKTFPILWGKEDIFWKVSKRKILYSQ